PTPSPSATPSPTPTPSPSATPSPTPTPSPSATPSSTPTATPTPVSAPNIVIVNFAFLPDAITVYAGEVVRWVNSSTSTTHNVTSPGWWDSGPIGPGESFSLELLTPGVYTYYDSRHANMTGSITVLDVTVTPTPTPTATSTQMPTSTPGAGTPTATPQAASTSIPVQGGVLRSNNGAVQVNVPPLPRGIPSLTLEFKPQPTPAAAPPAAQKVLFAFQIEVSVPGIAFDQDVEIKVHVSADDLEGVDPNSLVVYRVHADGRYEALPTMFDPATGYLTAKIRGFSSFAVVVKHRVFLPILLKTSRPPSW
ncbi:MAG: cupredoxin domain-containing protein, partial [Chloroflexi bacterium]|nr:cupredoxin domain-containing protein [Chloroflexota bacterium]